MTRAIYKYSVRVSDGWQAVAMPGEARILHVACQEDAWAVQVWAEVDITSQVNTITHLQVFGTGQSIPDGAVYVGSTMAGAFVWHVYEAGQ